MTRDFDLCKVENAFSFKKTMELANFNKSNTQNETNTYLRSLQFTIYNIIAMHNLAVSQFTMRDYTRNFTHVAQTSILFNIASTFM